MKVFIYARKSTESKEKQVLSIESQILECRNMADQWGLEVIDVFTEEQSAMSPGRAVFNTMMQRVYSREADGILAWKLDRLSRNFIDTNTMDGALKYGVLQKIFTSERTIENNTNDKFLLGLDLILSKRMVEDMANNIRRGMKTKFEKGRAVGFVPYGYKWFNKDVVVDEERAHYVRKLFDMYATGEYSIKTITRELEEVGMKTRTGKPVRTSTIALILKNKFYIGIMNFGEMEGEHLHPRLIEPEVFERVQDVLNGKGNGRGAKYNIHFFPYKGRIKCGDCGCSFTAEIQKGHVYYHCTKAGTRKCPSRKFLREDELEQIMRPKFEEYILPPSWAALGLEYLKKNNKEQVRNIEIARKALMRQIESIETQKMRLFEMRMGDLDAGDLELYTKKRSELNLNLVTTKAQLEKLETGTEDYYQLAVEMFELLRNISSITRIANPRLKWLFFNLSVSNLTISNCQIKEMGFHEPFMRLRRFDGLLSNSKKSNLVAGVGFEPTTSGL